jgi:hypothetical protein
MLEKTRSRRLAWLLAPAAALALVPAIGAAVAQPAAATATSEGTYTIYHVAGLAPGASTTKHWNNTPAGRSYFVDVRPSATTVTTACSLEVVHSWRNQNWNADNSRELEVWWTVQNVGSATCDGDVYLGYVD